MRVLVDILIRCDGFWFWFWFGVGGGVVFLGVECEKLWIAWVELWVSVMNCLLLDMFVVKIRKTKT